MNQTGYLILAISIIAALLVLFVVTFVLCKRTPTPKGCEQIMMDEKNCAGCSQTDCSFNKGQSEE